MKKFLAILFITGLSQVHSQTWKYNLEVMILTENIKPHMFKGRAMSSHIKPQF